MNRISTSRARHHLLLHPTLSQHQPLVRSWWQMKDEKTWRRNEHRFSSDGIVDGIHSTRKACAECTATHNLEPKAVTVYADVLPYSVSKPRRRPQQMLSSILDPTLQRALNRPSRSAAPLTVQPPILSQASMVPSLTYCCWLGANILLHPALLFLADFRFLLFHHRCYSDSRCSAVVQYLLQHPSNSVLCPSKVQRWHNFLV